MGLVEKLQTEDRDQRQGNVFGEVALSPDGARQPFVAAVTRGHLVNVAQLDDTGAQGDQQKCEDGGVGGGQDWHGRSPKS